MKSEKVRGHERWRPVNLLKAKANVKKLVLVGCLIIFLGCSNGVSRGDLSHLNGYWEIEQVVFSDGEEKNYKVNAMVDYIHLEGMEGFRKKLRPNYDGTYQTSDDAEKFVISKREGSFILNYKTGFSEWTELLTALDADTFSVVNEEGKEYNYKRFEPISIEKQ